jgi:hypothetical protein
MKSNIFKLTFLVFIFSFSIGGVVNAQVMSNGSTVDQFTNNNAFFEGATNFDTGISGSNINGKGLVFPRTDLTTWSFLTDDLDLGFIPSSYDGMIVYNTGTGATPITGINPTTSTAVVPGFYYFSNPTITAFDTPSITDGEWLPLGSSAKTKTTTINNVIAGGVSTVLDLDAPDAVVVGGGTIGEITNLLEAKIYNNTGQLVLTASSNYDNDTKELTTGNGGVNTLLSVVEGPYTVVLAYK